MGAVKRTHPKSRELGQWKRRFRKLVWDGWCHRPLGMKKRHYHALLQEFVDKFYDADIRSKS